VSNRRVISEQRTETDRERDSGGGWHLTQESVAVNGMSIPDAVTFQIGGADQIRATRLAKLDDLAKAIGAALDADIERLSREPRRAVTVGDEIERLRQILVDRV
jgi:hypothetical protein